MRTEEVRRKVRFLVLSTEQRENARERDIVDIVSSHTAIGTYNTLSLSAGR